MSAAAWNLKIRKTNMLCAILRKFRKSFIPYSLASIYLSP